MKLKKCFAHNVIDLIEDTISAVTWRDWEKP